AADPVMMVVMAINLLRLLQVGKGLFAMAFVLVAISARRALFFVFAFRAALVVALAGLAATLGFQVHLPADLQRDQPLHVGDVGKRTRQVSMLRVALAKMLDGAREIFECCGVIALAANHAPMGRIDVAQGDVIVSGAQLGFGPIENAHGLAPLAFLK